MFPFIFEWHWDAGRMTFMFVLYGVLMLIGAGLTFAFLKTLKDLKKGGGHAEHH